MVEKKPHMRKLSHEEAKLSNNSIKNRKTDIERLNKIKEILNFKINKELPYTHEQQIKKFQNDLKQVEREITDHNNIIEITEKQLKEGVEVKKPKKGDE